MSFSVGKNFVFIAMDGNESQIALGIIPILEGLDIGMLSGNESGIMSNSVKQTLIG
jgi:hypothetical protein